MDSYGSSKPGVKCRWSSYRSYKLILWAWMMNETTVMFTPVEVALNGFYLHGLIQVLAVIFIGIPLLYSEICIAQYTNCNIMTMWDFFPLLRYAGFGTLYLVILKTIYLLVLSSWYLEYTFFSALDPPPWYSCDEFNDTKCMVKSINVSVFQHCLEAEIQFGEDCGMKTASNCFFEREIGGNHTQYQISCLIPWKSIIASTTITLLLFLLSLKTQKFIQVFVKFLVVYVCIIILILFCVTLSTTGTWYATAISLDWSRISFHDCTHSMIRGILSIGTGCGIIIFLSRDAPFRSPATMTSVSVSLYSLLMSMLFTLINYSGIKTMIYFHGEEPNVIEIGSSVFFPMFACVSEIMNYFENVQFWSFAWFSVMFLCIFVNLWILHMYLKDLIMEYDVVRRYKNLSYALLLLIMSVISCPFFCSDLTAVLTDCTEIIQLSNCFLFSLSLYWLYGFKNHNIDIIFMIGIKASYFWKICWLINPIVHFIILYARWTNLEIDEFSSYYIELIDMRCDVLIFYIILSIYHAIVFFGIILQIYFYYKQGKIRKIFTSSVFWGPQDQILYKSRKIFVPEIMTTEFLYRQVRIRGYGERKSFTKRSVEQAYNEASEDGTIKRDI